jgi:hypothetical protein
MVVIGCIGTLGSTAGLACGEYLYRSEMSDLGWARAQVASVPAGEVADDHDGQLVHITGDLDAPGTRRDPTFGIERTAIVMERRVEMYQWEEETIDREDAPDKHVFERVWSEEYHDPERMFDTDKLRQIVDRKNSRMNPEKPYLNRTFVPTHASLGAYRVSEDVLREFGSEPVPLAREDLADLPDDLPSRATPTRSPPSELDSDNAICLPYQDRDDAASCGNRVGDVRIRWETRREGGATVVAGLEDGRLVPFEHDSLTEPLAMVDAAEVDADRVFEEAESTATTGIWLFRVIGLFTVPIFLFFVFQSFHDEEVELPRVGTLDQSGVFVACGLGTLTIMSALIVVFWVYFQFVRFLA